MSFCLTTVRVRGAGRHSRSGPSRLVSPDCSESTESGDNFVDCQERKLTSIPIPQTWSKEPKHLLLARNRIKVLLDGTFVGYERLATLDLQQNQISLVEDGAFQGLTLLTTLLLQHNRLVTLGEEALIPMPNLRYLRLYDNPWNCLCPMESLIRTLQVPSNRYLGNHARWLIFPKDYTSHRRTRHFSKSQKKNCRHKSHFIDSGLNCISSVRCAEPIRIKGKKLKQVDPELLCKESDSADNPQGDQTDNTVPVEPIPFRSKAHVTTVCHTYIFPKIRMDCSKRGKSAIILCFSCQSGWLIICHNEPH